MTTAPDLPIPARLTGAPLLSVVPDQPTEGEIELAEALRRAQPRLKRYAVRRLDDDHEAEEVVQEALLRAYQHRHLLATEDDLMAWTTVVTGRLVIDRLRVRGRSTPVAELPHNSRAERDTAEVVVARDEARLALDALEAMPGRQASVLWAREVEGLSYDEIGERFGMSEPSVRSLLHRARRTLRKEYAARGGTMPGIALVALAPWLHGLRAAGKLRHAARRTAATAAVTATGFVVAAVVPFSQPATPAEAAPAVHPALDVKTAHAAAAPAHHRAADSGAGSGTGVPVQPTDVRPATRVAEPIPGPLPRVNCDSAAEHGVSAGCSAPTAPTIYVKLPVAIGDNHGVGLSTDSGLCAAVPTTPLTECDTQPSKDAS
jgi:RNA polymerase sigma-70 factor (ECF subfamily)